MTSCRWNCLALAALAALACPASAAAVDFGAVDTANADVPRYFFSNVSFAGLNTSSFVFTATLGERAFLYARTISMICACCSLFMFIAVLGGILLASAAFYAADVYLTSTVDRILYDHYGPELYERYTGQYNPGLATYAATAKKHMPVNEANILRMLATASDIYSG